MFILLFSRATLSYIAGLGFEAARQLALKDETKKIILACRNAEKAKAAQESLEELTGKKIFDVLIIDVSDLESCRKAAENLTEPVDGIILVGGVIYIYVLRMNCGVSNPFHFALTYILCLL